MDKIIGLCEWETIINLFQYLAMLNLILIPFHLLKQNPILNDDL